MSIASERTTESDKARVFCEALSFVGGWGEVDLDLIAATRPLPFAMVVAVKYGYKTGDWAKVMAYEGFRYVSPLHRAVAYSRVLGFAEYLNTSPVDKDGDVDHRMICRVFEQRPDWSCEKEIRYHVSESLRSTKKHAGSPDRYSRSLYSGLRIKLMVRRHYKNIVEAGVDSAIENLGSTGTTQLLIAKFLKEGDDGLLRRVRGRHNRGAT